MTTTETAAPAAPSTTPAPTGWQKFMRVAFHVVAILEAFTWAGLLYAMWMRYIVEVPEAQDPVPFWGMLHGNAFIVFLVVSVICWRTFRWRFWELMVAVLMAIPPLTTIPLELWYAKTGRLKPRVAANTRR